MTHMETPATNNTIAFLMASNNEDIAQDLANEITALKLELESLRQEIMDRRERHQLKAIELERVKQIAMHRLEVSAQRMIFVVERDANLARELADRFPLTSELVNDAPKNAPKTREEAIENWKGIYRDQTETRPIRDREREELDAMTAKNNEWLDAHSARMTFVNGRWVIAESKL